MMKSTFRLIGSAGLAFLLLFSLSALAGETGSISGKVVDANGAPIPGVLVKASGPQLPAGRTVSTSASGAYNFQRLAPGKYTVTAELQGLGKASRSVTVTLDNDVQVPLALMSSAKTEVVVTATATEVDKKSTEVSVNFAPSEMREIPIARSYQGLLNLVPGAPADTSGIGLVTIAGGTRQDNKYLVDGVNITNPGYGNLGVDTNELDFADVNIKKGAISAEFGRTAGGIVNAVTKSGTNELHGGARLESRPAQLQSANAYATTSDVDVFNAAANLGFPIVKDTLFGYVSGLYSTTTTSGQSATLNGTTTTLPDSKTTGGEYFGKLTGYLGSSFVLNAGFRGLPSTAKNQFGSVYDTSNAGYDSDVSNNVASVMVDWLASKDTFVEAKYVHLYQNGADVAQNILTPHPPMPPAAGVTIPPIDPNNPCAIGSYADPARNNGNCGSYAYAHDATIYRRDEVKLTASQFLDVGATQHQIKIGGGAEFADYDLSRDSNGWGTINSSTFNPGTGSVPAWRARFYNALPQQLGRARTYSAFLQDTITWDRLSFNLGVLTNYDDLAQIMLDGTRVNFMTIPWSKQWQPRLGVVYNAELLKGDKFYANYGEYTGLDQKNMARSQAPARIRDDYAFFSKSTGSYLGYQQRGSSSGHLIPPDLDAPVQQEIVLGYSAPLGNVLSFDVNYQYRNVKNPLEDTPIDVNNYNGSFVLNNFPDARRLYRALSLELTKRYANGWYAYMSYTYSTLRGNFDDDFDLLQYSNSSRLEDEPGLYTNEIYRYGTLGQDRPHVFKLMGSVDLPLNFSVGGYLRVQSGTAWQAAGNTANYTGARYLEDAGSNRLPTWTNFDFLAAYNFKFGDGMSVRIEGRIQNLFNTQTVLSVNSLKYLDPYLQTSPTTATLTPQQTNQPNPLFGTPTSWTAPRRFVLTALFNF